MKQILQKRRIIRLKLPEAGNILLFWLLVVAIPLLVGKIVVALYLENHLSEHLQHTEMLLHEDLDVFSKSVWVEPFVETKIAEIEDEFARVGLISKKGLAGDNFVAEIPDAVKFAEKLKWQFRQRLGLEPLMVMVNPLQPKNGQIWTSAAYSQLMGFPGRFAVKNIWEGLRLETGLLAGSARPIFWQVLNALFGADFAKAFKNRGLNSTFTFKSGGKRLFLYLHLFAADDRKNNGSSGYMTLFLEEQIDRKLHWRWAVGSGKKSGISRRIVALGGDFSMKNQFKSGFFEVFRPVPIRALRVGSHNGQSLIQRFVKNGFFFQRPARYFFLVSRADLRPFLKSQKNIQAVVAFFFLLIGFFTLFFLRNLSSDGRIRLRIRSKLFLGIFTATILPIILFFALASRYFQFYQELKISHARDSVRQHLKLLELNIRNNEQLRNYKLEKLKECLNSRIQGEDGPIRKTLEEELNRLYQGYFLVRSDGLMLEHIPVKALMRHRDSQRLKLVIDLFKGQCFRIFSDLGILRGKYYDKLKDTPTGRQLTGLGEFYDQSDLDNFCLQDGQYFMTDKAEKGLYQFTTFNLLPPANATAEKSRWAFVGFMQELESITSDYLNTHSENWKFFFKREGDMRVNTVIYSAELQKDGRYTIGRAWPGGMRDDPEMIAAASRISENLLEDSWVSWQQFPVIFAARKLDKIPFIAVSRSVPENSATGKEGLLIVLLLLLLYSIILVLLIALFISDMLMKPLQTLLGATEMVNEGDFPQISYRADNELSQVVARFNEMTVGMHERRKLERFVSEEATRTIENEILLQREHTGERLRAAIVFVHIRGFDELCETLLPDQLIACLNLYFAAMEPVIRHNHGVIDKYIGDAIMVVFTDSGNDTQDSSAHACLAALAMLDCQKELALQLQAEKLPPMEIGVGIAIGEVIRGKIGAETGRKDFTVIGDVVNLAARLESLSRKQPTPSAMVSAEIVAECRSAFCFEKCGETSIKGKKDKQLVFRLIGVAHG